MQVEAYPAYRFAVQIEGVTEAIFTECTLPSLEIEVQEQLEGGYNDGTHLLPGRVRKGTVTLKRGLTRQSALLGWYSAVLQGQITPSRRQVSVLLLDSVGATVMRWDFAGAYPTKWTGPALNSGGRELAIETLELAFESVAVS